MKTYLALTLMIASGSVCAQEHFAGISTSQRTGILNSTINSAELSNLPEGFSANAISLSAFMSNNKMGFSDLINSNSFEEDIFAGDRPASIRLDLEILGPSLAYKTNKWTFSFTTAGKTKANIVDINNELGNAIVNGSAPESIETATAVLVDYNQKATATTWGEIGLGVAREVVNIDGHTLSAGATFKILFPGTYARMNASGFRGTIGFNGNSVGLTDAYTNINFAYSGALADDFTNAGNFTDYFGSGPNGFSVDFGLNYNWKPDGEDRYRINGGVAFRNIGAMTFKDSNNQSNSYIVDVPNGAFFDLQQFSGQNDIKRIEQLLVQSGYAQITKQNTNFEVDLPTTFAIYADARVYENWYIGAFLQQKMKQDYEERQIAAQNIFTVTPRYATDSFEVFLPLSDTEISGFAAGIGARYRGFYIGSGSVLTALLNDNDTHQADAYIGFRFAL